MVAALAGLRVVEMGSGIAVGYATRLLADLGATVVKVEPPGGDPLRHDRLWRYLSAGKSITARLDLDLDSALGAVDVVIEALGPGALDVDQLIASSPGVAIVRISPFGQDGPYRDRPVTDLVLQAVAGWVNSRGLPDHDPVMVGGRLSEYAVASYAAAASLTAYRAARDLEQPVIADLSMFECLVGTLAYPMLQWESLSALGLPPPDRRHHTLPGIVRASDGWVGLNALTGQHWQDICAMVGAPEWKGKQRDLAWGGPDLDAFYARLQQWLSPRTVDEVVSLAQAFRIPAAPVADAATLASCPQFEARGWLVNEPDGCVLPGPPYRLSPGRAIGAPSAVPASPRPRRDAEAYLPFAGLRVIDMGTFWAGPYAAMYLGAFGADVIKIESVQRPDGFRYSGAYPQEGPDWHDRSGIWQATNLNKRDLTLDLSRLDGRQLLRRLIATADILIENFSARVMDSFGLSYADVSELRPDIIMVRMPGFGLEGPWRDYVGWAMGIEQASGMAWATGDPDGRPRNPGGFLDPVIAMQTSVAIQAALENRRRTGEGQLIEVAQLETAAAMCADQLIAWSIEGEIPGRWGNRCAVMAPQGIYPGAGDREWVALSIRDDDDWQALVDLLDRPEWASAEKLATVSGRLSDHDEIDAHLSVWTSTRSAASVVDVLLAAGIPAGTLLRAPAMYDEPQLVARSWYQSLDHPLCGRRRYPGWPMRWSWPGSAHHRSGAPTLGQHNAGILGGDLGLTADDLARLAADRIIGDWPQQ
jgi:crotonobetainyl-CoA:carnitine CoA-transferase CaiB-like acyl-CoA transferase